jgi:1-aminocyclopropane-1-carboxylate deaminase/D-cysteine desulfhydrase-like pyridoxal-dependent ACC family enzyme
MILKLCFFYKLNCREIKQETFMPLSVFSKISATLPLKEPGIMDLEDSLFDKKGISVSMLRLDNIHPVISGNKLFKLVYFLKDAIESGHKTVITFGGAYSNHLAATAFACESLQLKSVGIVRGEPAKNLSHTLQFCLEHGMGLELISRSNYKNVDENYLKEIKETFGEHILIPEGGFSEKGKRGASLINEYFDGKHFTHVALPVGTATTMAGIIDVNKTDSKILGFGILKGMNDLQKRFRLLKVAPKKDFVLINDYHFGGYAKKSKELISFMNDFFDKHLIPLDFVYTAKMMFGMYDLTGKNFFERGSKILCIHTGGLQGNKSLGENVLHYD